MNTYFFPINSTSLAHYFGCTCIKAAKYFKNKPQDIQDIYKDFLLFTDKKGTKETDCCLELVLTKEEIDDLIDAKNGWFLLDTKPLPITRIKKIYFSEKEQMDNTITNIRMSTAFVPDFLVEVLAFDENPLESIQVPTDCQGIDQTGKINQYDRFLGALALMRLAHEPNMNYSQNYIATLSYFNQSIYKQLKTNERVKTSDAFQGIFTNSNGFEKVTHYLEHPIDEESLNSVAQENNQIIKKDKITRIIDVESLTDTWTYTIAILNAYGVGDESRKKRVDELIQSNFSTLKEGKQEGVALCYGYNRGYSAFTKSYGEVAFKYKLDSQLDYYTIESIYQYVFNEIVSSDFPYLDDWCPKRHPKQPKRNTDYLILDELIIGKKKAKVFSEEWWNGLRSKFNIFGVLAEKIIENTKVIVEKDIYPDIVDELQEDFEIKLENSLKNRLDDIHERIIKLENEKHILQDELNRAKEEAFRFEEGKHLLQEQSNEIHERMIKLENEKHILQDELNRAKEVTYRLEAEKHLLQEQTNEIHEKMTELENEKHILQDELNRAKEKTYQLEEEKTVLQIKSDNANSYAQNPMETIVAEPEIEYGAKYNNEKREIIQQCLDLCNKKKNELLDMAKCRNIPIHKSNISKEEIILMLMTRDDTETCDLFSQLNVDN